MKRNYLSQYKVVRLFFKCSTALFFCLFFQFSFAQNYQLVFEDEFDGTAVDLTNWTFQIGDGTSEGIPGWGNNELQYYREENTTVANGFMTITAKEESFGGYNYTSSRLITKNKQDFTYGRMEMRAKMPIGKGMWPAFWMLFTDPTIYGSWAAGGEIDIMEYLGDKPEEIIGTIHYGQPFPGNLFTTEEFILTDGTNFNDDFHEFAIEWEPGEIRWYVDDILYATQNDWFSNGGPYPAPFDQPFHFLLNLAVGGNLPGNPDATTVFPQEYVIDYVRVYEDLDLPTVVLNSPSDGDTFSAGDAITLTATPAATQGVDKVEFYQGDLKLGEATSSPYEITISDIAEGSYRIRALVIDLAGKINYSPFAEIQVGAEDQGPYALVPVGIPGMVEAENFDVGGQGVAYNDSDPTLNEGTKVVANRYRNDEGPDIEPTSDTGGGSNIGFVADGEWLEYTVNVAQAGSYDIIARVASGGSSGSFNLEFDGVDKTGAIGVPATGGFQSWADVIKESVVLEAGIQVLRINFLVGGFNINKITFQPADPSSGEKVVFDDMEHGDPFNNAWFAFGGSVGGGGVDPNASDLPPLNGGAFSLQTGWGSGGTPGFYGGFGRTNLVNISQTTFFNMWINPDADQDYTLEINLQELDEGNSARDEFQYNLTVSPTGPGAIAGGGWQLISIPLTDFFDDNSNIVDGNSVLDDLIENVVIAVIGNTGSDATFRTDYWSFTNGPLGPEIMVDPISHDYGDAALNTTSSRVFSVTNEGCTALNITGFSLTGTDTSEFSLPNGNDPFVVSPGQSQNILVRFNPTSLGAKTATLTINSDDADEGLIEIPLTGTGIEGTGTNKVVFDDMEHGDPDADSGYFTFNGESTPSVSATTTDLPPEDGGGFAIDVSLDGGSAGGFLGGFGRTFPIDLTDMTHFNFWINPDAGQDYTIEIQLQEDDNGDDDVPFGSADDDEFQYNLTVNASGQAVSGGGWQLISIPLSSFFDDGTFFGGNGILDPISTANGGNGQLVNVIFGFLTNSGAPISFRTDLWCFSQEPIDETGPMVAAPDPTEDPANVISLFSNVYDDVPVDTFRTDWSNGNLEDVQIEGNDTKKYTNLSFVGIETVANQIDITGMTHFHTDIWTPDATQFRIKLVDFGMDGAFDGGDDVEHEITIENPAQGEWVSLDLPLTDFTGLTTKMNIAQLIYSGQPAGQFTVFVDNIYFYNADAAPGDKVVFDDMEHGDPFNNGWFAFNGDGGGGLDANSSDLPPENGGSFSLQTGWGIGTGGFVGGFGRSNTVDISGMTNFDMWINPDAAQDYVLEINLQEDENGDGAPDEEFQYNLPINPTSTISAGGGWQQVSIPLADFFDDNSFLNGGNGVMDNTIVNIVIAVVSTAGGDATFRTDFWCFSRESSGPSEPMVAAPDPTQDPANVISLFSGVYNDVPVDTFRTPWSDATFEDVLIEGNATKKYSALNFVGIETVANQIDVTGMTHFRTDIWTADATQFRIKLVDFGEDGAFDGGDDVEHEITIENPAQGEWISLDIPLADFTGLTKKMNIAQLIYAGQPAGEFTVFIDNIYFYNADAGTGPTEPMVAAPDPTQDSANVISLFSGVYNDVPVDTFRTPWSDATLEDVLIEGNATKKYSALNFVGIETVANQIDATGMTHFSVDVWSADATQFRIKLVDFGEDGAFDGGDDVEHELTFENPAQGEWISYDIPLTAFEGLTKKMNIAQLIFAGQPAGEFTVFIDNIYFYNADTGGGNPDFALYINSGGGETVFEGKTFQADTYFNGGDAYSNALVPVAELHQSERTSGSKAFGYGIPVPDGEYDVSLYFTELFWGSFGGGVGSRVFDVMLEGGTVLDDYDIIAEVGAGVPVKRTFRVTVSDGELNIDLDALGLDGLDQPTLSGICVVSVGGGAVNTKPVITLNGAASITLNVGDTYVEEGATATDPEEGDLPVGSITIGGDTVDTGTPGTYVVTYNVMDSEGLAADQVTRTVSVETLDEPNFSVFINSGGGETILGGKTFVADTYFNGGNTAVNNLLAVAELHKTERTSGTKEFGYDIAVPNAEYDVTLYFTEIFWGAFGGGPGSRVFDVMLEGGTVLDDYDIIADVGAGTAVSKTFRVMVSDGQLDIDLDALGADGVDQPTLSGIAVQSIGGTINNKPVISLNGLANITLTEGDAYTEEGATANDPEDGPVAVSIGGDTVDTGTPGTYVVTYDAVDSQGLAADQVVRTVTVQADGPTDFALRINAGGPETVLGGDTFIADAFFTGGSTASNSGLAVPELHRTERSSPTKEFGYELPLVNGQYEVTLYFTEIFWGLGTRPGVGARVFDVQLEGSTVLDDFDIVADSGAGVAVSKTFTITVLDGQFDLYLESLGSDGANQPTLSGIEIVSQGGSGASLMANINAMSLSPNPANITSVVSFEQPEQIEQIKVFDLTGRLIQSFDAKKIRRGDTFEMDVYPIPAGTYIVRAESPSGLEYNKQMVIKR
ncbi:malectin domain-containing carbohydrate-binding protein [Croceivirga thetidis]|uniref:DUF5011 domain-containing protein n=1 Tax=Croceivirga thetidis TaxID=2721623 RepID=A0ABX1GPV5_9FLAO|nr:malectin domain-containing carbohydrate-binding protein [Croceivirga thetidis]NKI31952.1 DUF5011 domain-containing protein [Croceivirga thetidis]